MSYLDVELQWLPMNNVETLTNLETDSAFIYTIVNNDNNIMLLQDNIMYTYYVKLILILYIYNGGLLYIYGYCTNLT
jgi:hypothetical protein